MQATRKNPVVRLIDRVFPRMPDFYGLMDEQCALMVSAMEEFVDFMRTGSPENALHVAGTLEKKGDELKRRNMQFLAKSFATPIDREEIYRAIEGIDHVINYAKTTIKEMEAFEVSPDAHTLEMAIYLKEGAEALHAGFEKLGSGPAEAEADAMAARKAERRVEKAYRKALTELFAAEESHSALQAKAEASASDALRAVTELLKRREIYRHLSNAADRMAHAGQTLHDIIVKIA